MADKSHDEIMEKSRQWLQMGGADFVRRLVDVYAAESASHMATLAAAFKSGDAALSTRSAHTLKSSSGNVGALTFANLAKKIELACREGKMAEMADTLAAAENEYARVKAALEAVRTSLTDPR